MNNIWKYTLVFCFTVITDQLIKGSIQGFVENGNTIQILPMVFFMESKFLSLKLPWSKVLAYTALLTNIYVIKNIIIFRNKSFYLGLMRTFLMIGLFTVFLDQISLGYIVNYINIGGYINLSIGKSFLVIGSLTLFTNLLQSIRQKS